MVLSLIELIERDGEVTVPSATAGIGLTGFQQPKVRRELDRMVREGRLYKASMGNGKPTWYGSAI